MSDRGLDVPESPLRKGLDLCTRHINRIVDDASWVDTGALRDIYHYLRIV